MSVLVVLEFPTAPGRLAGLRAFLEEILPGTRAASGFLDVRLGVAQDSPAVLLSVETWTSREAFEKYFAWRQETGVITQLGGFLTDPPVVRFFTDVTA